MRIPFIERFFSSKRFEGQPKLGSQKNITHSTKVIARLLETYANENHLIAVRIGKPDGTINNQIDQANTGIISLDDKKKTITLDAFSPNTHENKLERGTQLHFSLTHAGTYCQFTCQYQKTVSSNTGHAHVVTFPKGIENTQLRDTFRVQINPLTPIKISLLHETKPVIFGTAVDLSSQGVRLKMIGLMEPKPRRGDEYLSCQLILTDGYSMHSEARLMHWMYDSQEDCTILGIQLIGLDGANERILNRYITQLQRKEKNGIQM
ncbi:MAG: flagellar brake protein [Gammaproteobacteria bacterium]|nr:flagellar brake protein [Gammaproteobacteria bacterium]